MKLRRLFFYLMLLGYFWPSLVHAQVAEICGDGVDNDGVGGDVLCTNAYAGGHDKDRDCYWDNGLGPCAGTDPDDTDRKQFPDAFSTTGCAAGSFKQGLSNGTYTSCKPLSSLTVSDVGYGTTQLFWISPTGVTTAGAGTFLNPADYRCISDPSLACYHSPTQGDAIELRGGNYTLSWSDAGTARMFYFAGDKDGTSAHKIVLESAPGEVAVIKSPGVSPTEIFAFYMTETSAGHSPDYWVIRDLTVDGGYSNAGLHFNPANNIEILNVVVKNIDGILTSNTAGIKLRASSDNFDIHHVDVHDNYSRANPAAQDNTQVIFFAGVGNIIRDSVIYTTYPGGAGYGVKYKHAESQTVDVGDWVVYRNIIFNFNYRGIAWGQPHATIRWNYIQNALCFQYADQGGPIRLDSAVVQDNTCNHGKGQAFNLINDATDPTGPVTVLNFQRNVIVDDLATTYDGADEFFNIGHYMPDANYTDVYSGGKLTIDNNCYYNSHAVPLNWGLFGSGAGSLGFTTTVFATWQAAGLDVHSFIQNPSLNADGIALAANCSGFGWATDASGGVTTTTTSSASTTTTTTVNTTTTTAASTSVLTTTVPGPEGAGTRSYIFSAHPEERQ